MAKSRDEAARELRKALDAQQKLRQDEKAWKAEMKKVNAAHDDYRRTFERDR